MPHITDDAICIRRWDWSETSQTVSLLTRCHGVIRGLAKGAKREKGRFSGGIDLLARGQVVAILKNASRTHAHSDSPLATLTDWSVTELYPALRCELAANRAGLYIADLVNHMIIDHDPHPGVFEALASALSRLSDRAAIAEAILQFQWTLLCLTGFQPELHRDIETGAELESGEAAVTFIPSRGGFTIVQAGTHPTTGAAPGWPVRVETLGLLRTLSAARDDCREAQRVGGHPVDLVKRANRLLAAYLRELIGSELPTLRWVFPDLARA